MNFLADSMFLEKNPGDVRASRAFKAVLVISVYQGRNIQSQGGNVTLLMKYHNYKPTERINIRNWYFGS